MARSSNCRRSSPDIRLDPAGDSTWKITSSDTAEFDLTSIQDYKAKPGDTFEVNLRIKVDLHTRALPELVYYDAAGREIPVRSSLATGPDNSTTYWQTLRRVFPAQPGTASVRARLRASGKGEVMIAALEFRPAKVDTYQTGVLISQIYPKLRRGLVLESNLGIVNTEMISKADRDGDGKWALIQVDLDKLSVAEQKGEDWRTKFEYRPNEIYWSDGAVLKSDSVLTDRAPDLSRALHFRMKAHQGPYRAILNDPGRAVAVSLDGKSWKRFEGGSEAEIGTLPAQDGMIEFWLDACYRDRVSAEPAYFDYVRLFPADHAPSVDRLFEAARKKSSSQVHSSVAERKVAVHLRAPRSAIGGNWPVRCSLPIPQGELGDSANAGVLDAQGRAIPSQNRALATWPDSSVKWLYLDFSHDFSKSEEASYTVAYGSRIHATPPAKQVHVESTANGVEVDTGAIRFSISKSHFGIVENVQQASGRQLQREPVSVEIAEASGKLWRALDLPVERLEVEQAGPLHTVILVETELAPSGKPASGFVHRARIHAYAGSPLVQIDYFVANTDDREKLQVRSIAMKIQPTGRGVSTGVSIQATSKTKESAWTSLGGEAMLSAGLEAFREQYPKALRWKPDGLEIDLWAAEGGDYEWVQGVGKTHRISLFYGSAAGDASLLAHGPALTWAAPEWYTASGAFGPIEIAAKDPLIAVEKTLATHMESEAVEKVGLGFENYGDHSNNGYVKGAFLWNNNEYDLPAGAMIHFVRTGNRAALNLGLFSALHYLDVDTIHYSRKNAGWAGAAHTHSHGDVGHHTADPPNMHHAGYVQGLIWYSYFTGEPIGVLGAKSIAGWALRNLKPDGNVGQMERALGHPMMTLNDVYEATWDDKYIGGSARLVDWALKWEHPVHSGFLAPITEQPAYYSGSTFNSGLLPSALLKFNSWANLPEVDQMLERVARWTLTEMWRPEAGIMSKGGSPRRGADPQNIATHLRMLRSVYSRTEDPLFLAVPREAILAGFTGDGKDFSTRATGLVFNYLPWFLPLLAEWRSEPELEVKAVAPNVETAPGKSTPLCFAVSNRGASAVTGLRISFQPRLDFQVTQSAQSPGRIEAGASAQFCYETLAPERINLTSEYNRISYAHWTATYRRQDQPRLAHAWAKITLRER